MCYGCKQRHLKELGPPNDICIQHEEWHTCMVGGTSQSLFGNAYYHASIACVHLVWPSFQPSMLVVLPAIELCKFICIYCIGISILVMFTMSTTKILFIIYGD